MFKKTAIAALLSVALCGASAEAVIVAGPQGRNLSAPTGDLVDSGWDLEGQYGFYTGTPISPDWFVTAIHFGNADSKITLADGDHPLTGRAIQVTGTDVVLRQVSVPFAQYATMFNPASDGGELTTADRLVVFGRGVDRGPAIAGHGYAWGDFDSQKAWGTNTFEGKYTVTAADVAAGSKFAVGTSFLTADFDNDKGPNEATVGNGDSGGGVFVSRGGQWKLVGVNYGVELFRDSPTGGDLLAAIYDGRGLYQQNEAGDYVYVDPATTTNPVPQTWFASYLPDVFGLIGATPVVAVPEPGLVGAIGVAAVLLGRRRRGAV